jgi:glycosyltransferase involved in cell wall biosynthesis
MLGGRCKIYINEPRENISELMRESNIYLHTTNPAIPFGQPVSIAEAMTCGNYILARNVIGSAEYIGNDTICSSGKLYDTKEELISLLQETLDWDDIRWLEIRNNSIYNAQKYLPNNALKNLIDSFLTIL